MAARFYQEESELRVAESWHEKAALEDIFGIKKELINDDSLYRGLDKLGEKREALLSSYRMLQGLVWSADGVFAL